MRDMQRGSPCKQREATARRLETHTTHEKEEQDENQAKRRQLQNGQERSTREHEERARGGNT